MSDRQRSAGWVAGGILMAAVMALTGCSSGSDAAEKETRPSKSPTADPGKSPGSEQGDASDASQASATDQSTAERAIAAWVTAVVKNQPKEACLLMGEAATGSTPARAGTESTCDSNSPEGKRIQQNLGQFQESFTPDPPSADPEVEVAGTSVTGDETVIPADKITIDGQTLDKIILSHSTGVEPGQLDVKVHSSKIENRWYVTNLDFDIG
ncbi:hypothetical protein [Streptomyces viridosporus]|uniref:hypothetical protein n=1 Tax=Streptomyces viridosporus TaxID=67581 RepID=UPI0036F73863